MNISLTDMIDKIDKLQRENEEFKIIISDLKNISADRVSYLDALSKKEQENAELKERVIELEDKINGSGTTPTEFRYS